MAHHRVGVADGTEPGQEAEETRAGQGRDGAQPSQSWLLAQDGDQAPSQASANALGVAFSLRPADPLLLLGHRGETGWATGISGDGIRSVSWR